MANITLKNIPDPIYTALKQSAEKDHRSLNSQIIYYIEKGIGHSQTNRETVLETARSYRARTAELPLTEELLNEAKNSGRK